MKDKNGWDGKLRVEPKATITNPEALEDPDYSDSDAPPVEEIEADEGMSIIAHIYRDAVNRYNGNTRENILIVGFVFRSIGG